MIRKQLNRLQQLDQLIRQQRTGNANQLALKLEISRRQVYNLLEELKMFGLDIEYDKVIDSYIYSKGITIKISFGMKELLLENNEI